MLTPSGWDKKRRTLSLQRSPQASPSDTQARIRLSITQPSRHQSSVFSPTTDNESPHIAVVYNMVLANMDENLQKLENIINASDWLRYNDPEPRIGNPNCPAEADQFGIRGESVFTAFVEDQNNGTYGCKYEPCHAYSTRSLEEAVRHQRHHHFNHSPYACVPTSGNTWYVSPFLLLQCAGWSLIDPPFAVAAASPLKSTSRITSKSARCRLSRESMPSLAA